MYLSSADVGKTLDHIGRILGSLALLGWHYLAAFWQGVDDNSERRRELLESRTLVIEDLQGIREAVVALSQIYDQQSSLLGFREVLLKVDLSQQAIDRAVRICCSDRRAVGHERYEWRDERGDAMVGFRDSLPGLQREVQSMICELAAYIPTTMPILLSERITERITYEQIKLNPQSAVQYAFALFEARLRGRLRVGPEVFGQTLINKAFADQGRLTYGDLPAEQEGTRNLMSGAYATLRSPRMHRVIEDNERVALTIIALVDLLMQIVRYAPKKLDSVVL